MKEKKIALVHDWLVKFGGAEQVLKVLCDMFPEAPIFTLIADKEIVDKHFSKMKVFSSFLNRWPNFIKKRNKLLLPFLPAAIESLDLKNYDLVISDSNSFAHGIITKPGSVHICYCHSPMRYAWDWKNEYQIENGLGGTKRFFTNLILNWIRVWDYYSSKRVDVWLANSNHVANRVKKYYGIEPTVIYPPIDMSKYKTRKVKEEYFLVLSRLEPYKNIDLAVSCFNKLNLPLVIIGKGSQENKLKSSANDNIKFLGFQTDQVIREYLAGARALIFPGEEDFGIVPVEAMASGTPVIAYRAGGALETVTEGLSGIFFDRLKLGSLEQAVIKFMEEEDNFDCLKIRESVKIFDSYNFIEKINKLVNNYQS